MKALLLSFKLIQLLIYISLLSSGLYASQYHVSTLGKPTGRGTISAPWDLATALAHPFIVQAGDTIWIHGGTYHGCFESRLKGTAESNIIVRQYPNESVIIKGYYRYGKGVVLNIKGAYTTYWGFSVTNSEKQRISSETRKIRVISGVNILGHHIKLINLFIYDNPGSGIGFWSTAKNSEIYGCIIFNNGWQRTDKGTGHAIYAQNEVGTKIIRDNIIFNGFSYGIHAYTERGAIKGFHIEGNTIFNNGILSKGSKLKPNILIGGYKPADRITLLNNLTYHNLGLAGQNIELGYTSQNDSISILKNSFIGGGPVFQLLNWKRVYVKENTFYGTTRLVTLNANADTKFYVWNNNTYYEGRYSRPMNNLNFKSWIKTYSIDQTSHYHFYQPKSNEIFVNPNMYEAGRGHITIFNWEGLEHIQIDLSGILKEGMEYKIFDVENLLSEPIIEGVFSGGKITIPLNLTDISSPNGDVPNIPNHTGIEFGAYLLISN